MQINTYSFKVSFPICNAYPMICEPLAASLNCYLGRIRLIVFHIFYQKQGVRTHEHVSNLARVDFQYK